MTSPINDKLAANRNAGQHVAPSVTPNVVIENPRARKGIRTVLDVIGGLAFIVAAADVVAPEFDAAFITVPVLAGYAAARSVFGFTVDNTNTPSA